MTAGVKPRHPWREPGPGTLREALRLPDGRVLTASSGGVIAWDPATGDLRGVWTDATGLALALSPDETRVAVAHPDRTLCVYDLAGAAQIRWRRPPGDEGVLLRWDALLVVCTTEGLWGCDPDTGEVRETWDAGETWMLAAAGGRVLHGATTGALRFLPGQAKGETVRAGEVSAVALRADGRAATAVGSGLRAHDARLREIGRRTLPGRVVALDMRDDGTVVAGLADGRVKIGEAAPWQLAGWLAENDDAPTWRFAGDGRHLTVYSAYHGLVEVFDLETRTRLGHVGCFGEQTFVLAVAPDRILVHALFGDGQSTSESGTLVDTTTGRCLWRSPRGLPPGLIEVDPRRGLVILAFAAVEVVDGRTGACSRIELPSDDEDEDERVVLSVTMKDDDIVIELEDRKLRVDVEAMTLVPWKRTRRRR